MRVCANDASAWSCMAVAPVQLCRGQRPGMRLMVHSACSNAVSYMAQFLFAVLECTSTIPLVLPSHGPR